MQPLSVDMPRQSREKMDYIFTHAFHVAHLSSTFADACKTDSPNLRQCICTTIENIGKWRILQERGRYNSIMSLDPGSATGMHEVTDSRQRSWQVVYYRVGSNPVSLYLPLHWLLGRLLMRGLHGIGDWKNNTIQSFFSTLLFNGAEDGLGNDAFLQLMDYPLRGK